MDGAAVLSVSTGREFMTPTHSAILAAALAMSPSALLAVPVAFALGDGGTTLVRLGAVNANTPLSGVAIRDSVTNAPVALTDIDFEKETNSLYGVSAALNGVFLVDPQTGVATFRANLPVNSDAGSLFIDWNNSIDRMRIVSARESDGSSLNFVFNQDANTVTQFTDLFYAMGDPNEGAAPLIVGNAYRDAVATSDPGTVGTNPPPQGGVQLAIDATTDALVSFANNAGTLMTLASFDFDVTGPGGFDIFSTPDGLGGFDDVGYALLRGVPQGQGAGGAAIRLVSFALPDDLSGGVMVTTLRTFGVGQFGGLQGLALIDSGSLPAPIPLPAPFALLLAGLAAIGVAGRRRLSRA